MSLRSTFLFTTFSAFYRNFFANSVPGNGSPTLKCVSNPAAVNMVKNDYVGNLGPQHRTLSLHQFKRTYFNNYTVFQIV